MKMMDMLMKCGEYILPGLVENLGPAKKKQLAAGAKGKRVSARKFNQG
jgi:hypothetical protein